MPSGHLTAQEREVIGQMRYAGHGLAAIAEKLERNKSTLLLIDGRRSHNFSCI